MENELLNHCNYTNVRIKASLGQFMENCEMSGIRPRETVAGMISLLLANAAEIASFAVDREGFLAACESAFDKGEDLRNRKDMA